MTYKPFPEQAKQIKISLYLTGGKGLSVLMSLASIKAISLSVIIGKDGNISNDRSEEIISFCQNKKIPFSIYPQTQSEPFHYAIAAGWQRMIHGVNPERLIIFHDSLLPRYRGFAPLVTALLNFDTRIGVTALKGVAEYDKGDIYAQESIQINYPIKISEAIDKIAVLYGQLAEKIVRKIINNSLHDATPQDEALATYSLWRDENDYRIDWNQSAEHILHFINCVGHPYKGASTLMNGNLVRIKSASLAPDLIIENRTSGKVIYFDGDVPVVVCGNGLLRLSEIETDSMQSIKIDKFRTRFE